MKRTLIAATAALVLGAGSILSVMAQETSPELPPSLPPGPEAGMDPAGPMIPIPAIVLVQAEFLYLPGAAPEGAAPGAARVSAAGLEVRAVPAGDGTAPPIATATTAEDGSAALALGEGSYWVFIPADAATAIPVGTATRLVQMPDGTPVVQWAEVEVGPGASQVVPLTIEAGAP